MRKPGNRPTLADVAKHAQVSTATASRVMHNTGPASSDLRKRILASASALGYASRASSVVLSEDAIAVLAGHLHLPNPYFSDVIAGIQDEAASYGLGLELFKLTDHPQQRQQLLQRLGKRAFSGVVVMGASPFPELLDWQSDTKTPMLMVNHFMERPGIYSIGIDVENAMYRATQYLLNLNHTRIGHIAGPVSWRDLAQSRRRGIERAMSESGLTLRPEWCAVISPGALADAGFHAMNNLLNLPAAERPTAVLAFNDTVAFGALHAIHACGLRVPQDISIIGVDDIFLAAHCNPPLTTIDQPKYHTGQLALEIVYQASQGRADLPSSTILESPLIIRESTGPFVPAP